MVWHYNFCYYLSKKQGTVPRINPIFSRKNYALELHQDPSSTDDDLREAVTTLEELERIARRVLGPAHPTAMEIEHMLRDARAALRARETAET